MSRERRSERAARREAGTVLLIAGITLSGCFAPVARGEAEAIARSQVDRYCHSQCGALALSHTQHIKGRWLIDFDSPGRKFTVTVEGDGNARVDAWDK